jgi:NADH:ubiquinone oxidoreductase subunit 5 (subunit L)/multisubunit Na+/H+ antiporter MnhA subunit
VLLIAPIAMFVVAVSSVRTRRSSSATAMFGVVVTLLVTLLVAWGLTRRSTPYVVSYQYINMSIAFSGPQNFQTFGIDFILHVDHLTVVALVAIELCMIGAIAWHQALGRSEPGAARFHSEILGLLFACVGVLVSWDLAELFGFWAIGGVMTYLLLGHRWGLDEPARRARVALALPFLTDLCLLCGIAWIYARYGTQKLDALLPILHTTPGWTVRSLVVGSVLLFIGIAGRLALWPYTSWITQTAVSAPPAGSAIVQSAWSVLAIVVLYRVMPIFVASNTQMLEAMLVACGVAAVVAPLLGLLGNEPRRIIALAGSGAVAVAAAVVINGFRFQGATFAVAGVACALAVAPARVAAGLAVSSIAAAMRTDDLTEMGDAWRRMRASSVALLAGAIVLGLSGSIALALGVSSRSKLGAALGVGVLLIAIAGLRVFLAVALGPRRRRRAFEPDRVREAPQGAVGWPAWLALAGAAFLVASAITGWLNFLDGHKHSTPGLGAVVVWAAVAIVGFAASGFVYARGKDGALAASAAGGLLLNRATLTLFAVVDRFLVAPVTDIARRVGEWIPQGDSALGRFTTASGQLALAAVRAPAVPLVIVLAVVMAVLFALIAPGIVR